MVCGAHFRNKATFSSSVVLEGAFSIYVAYLNTRYQHTYSAIQLCHHLGQFKFSSNSIRPPSNSAPHEILRDKS